MKIRKLTAPKSPRLGEAYIYTYKSKNQRVEYAVTEFFFAENKEQLEKAIDKLLDIDAVVSPADIQFPTVMRVLSGFGFTLEPVADVELEKLVKTINKVRKGK